MKNAILTKLQFRIEEKDLLRDALRATAIKRGSMERMRQYGQILKTVRSSETMQRQWADYRSGHAYAANISFDEVCDAAMGILDVLFLNENV